MYSSVLSLKIAPLLLMAGALLIVPIQNSYAQAGCCSGHQGISHCDAKTQFFVCKDKTTSPTCKCDGTTAKPAPVTKPKETTLAPSKAQDKKAVKEKKAADKKAVKDKKAAGKKVDKKSEAKKTKTKTEKPADDKKKLN